MSLPFDAVLVLADPRSIRESFDFQLLASDMAYWRFF